MMKLGSLIAAVVAVSISATPGTATINLEKAFSFGDHWYGPEFTLEDLKGRVVLIEDWGYN